LHRWFSVEARRLMDHRRGVPQLNCSSVAREQSAERPAIKRTILCGAPSLTALD
jgi:hypothetical protein